MQPEPSRAENFFAPVPDFRQVGGGWVFRIFPLRIFPPQEKRSREQGQDAAARQHPAPGNSEREQTARAQHADADPDRPVGMGHVHIAFRRIAVEILDKRGGDAFADAFAESRDQQERQQEPVIRRQCAQQYAAAHEQHTQSHGSAFPDPAGDQSADRQRRHDGDAPGQMQHASGRHPAVVQRKIQRFADIHQRNRDRKRAHRISDESSLAGKIITAEFQFFHESQFPVDIISIKCLI